MEYAIYNITINDKKKYSAASLIVKFVVAVEYGVKHKARWLNIAYKWNGLRKTNTHTQFSFLLKMSQIQY